MGLEDEYQRAVQHIETVDWTISPDPSKTFETNIRYLGGLLAAYDLRPEPVLLKKAQELADKVIMPAFNTPNRMPAAYVNVETYEKCSIILLYTYLFYFLKKNVVDNLLISTKLFWQNSALFNWNLFVLVKLLVIDNTKLLVTISLK